MAGVKRKAPSSSSAADAAADDDDKKKKNETSLIPPIDSDDVIQNRLRMGHGIKGGTRGSLTRCAGLVVNVVKQQQQQPDQSDPAAAAAAVSSRDKLIREFQHLQLEMTKWILTATRNEQELAAVQQRITELEHETARQKQQVAQTRAELQQQLHVTGCEREYDALAKIATSRHPISRKVLQQQLQQCQETIALTQQELQKRRAQKNVRQGQFQLLMQCILDLKQSLNEPLDDVKVPRSRPTTDEDEIEDSDSEGQAMEVDQQEQEQEQPQLKQHQKAGKKQKGSDDEDLYNDL